jgi:virginiamycin B lyase
MEMEFRERRRRIPATILAIAAIMASVAPASAVRITEFPTGHTGVGNITAGPDGNLWFTGRCSPRAAGGDCIYRITPAGVLTEFSNGIIGGLGDITAGPEGDLWFIVRLGPCCGFGTIGRITPAGVVTEFPGLAPEFAEGGSLLSRITTGAEGDLWITSTRGALRTAPYVVRVTPEGTVTNFGLPDPRPGDVGGITLGPEGDLWVAEGGVNRLDRFSPEGVDTEFPGVARCGSDDITTGLEGDLWFTAGFAECPGPSQIGRITPTGTVTEFSRGITGSPFRIAAGPDGNMWFTEFESDQIGRISPRGNVTEFSQGISPGAQPFAITAGPHDTVWFTEASGQIGRVSDIGHVKLGRLR